MKSWQNRVPGRVIRKCKGPEAACGVCQKMCYCHVFMHIYHSLLVSVCLYLKMRGQVGLYSFHKMETRSVTLLVTLPKGIYLYVPSNKWWVSACARHNADTTTKGQAVPVKSSRQTSEQNSVAQWMYWYKSWKRESIPGSWRAGLLGHPDSGGFQQKGVRGKGSLGRGVHQELITGAEGKASPMVRGATVGRDWRGWGSGQEGQ